ncbi:hypothetical protein GCK72_016816 [Caenorhabditis remanei]|uniref:F-box domain-containing protein n=1 Tax=Caenorhabditis remanei TaxID=31234 RepID=A0A6A5G709_CAERE|nr:hypothetical protein GCK72_016816 [Caenorhabditis remanei]KAF1750269.1 hypothetical protein GCK72_016816 [Caenorhabditis remanei]
MEKPFPLFRLPRIVIEEVIRIMSPFEIINFAMTSLKSKTLIKSLLTNRRNSYAELQLNTYKESEISIIGFQVLFECKVTSDKTKDGMREYKEYMETEKIYTLWIYSENVIDGWMKVVKTVKEIFKFKKHLVRFEIDNFPTQNKSIVDFIKSLTPSIERCVFEGFAETDEDFEYFLNNLNVTEYIEINEEFSDNFKFPQDNYLEYFSIDPGNWVTFDQLLHLKTCRLFIQGSPLTNYELNQFLILWMASECHQNLNFFAINITDPQSLDIIFNLPHERINPDVERIGRLPNNDTISLRGEIDIKRNDGMTATINFNWREDQMLLQMVVSRID